MRDSSTYVPVHADIWTNRKVKRLRRRLNVSEVEAVGHLVSLWTAALGQASDGILTGWDAEDVADAARWEGEPTVLTAALEDCGILEMLHGEWTLHEWELYAGKGIQRRSAARERMRALRAERKAQRERDYSERSRTVREQDGTFAQVLGEGEGEGKVETVPPSSEQRETRASAPPSLSQPAPPEDDPGTDAFDNLWGTRPPPPTSPASRAWAPPAPADDAFRRWSKAVADTRLEAWGSKGIRVMEPWEVWDSAAPSIAKLGEEVGWGVMVEAFDRHIASGRSLGPKDVRRAANYLRGVAEGIVGDRAAKPQKQLKVETGPDNSDLPVINAVEMKILGYGEGDWDRFVADWRSGKVTQQDVEEARV